MYTILGNISVNEHVLSTTMYFVEQTCNATLLTPISWYVNDIEALTPNHLLLSNENFCLPYLPLAEEFSFVKVSFGQLELAKNSYGISLVKAICQIRLIGKGGNLQLTKSSKQTNSSCWLRILTSESIINRVEETIRSSDGVMLSRWKTGPAMSRQTLAKISVFIWQKNLALYSTYVVKQKHFEKT